MKGDGGGGGGGDGVYRFRNEISEFAAKVGAAICVQKM